MGMALLTAGCATEEDFVYDVVDDAPQLTLTLTMQDAQIVTRATEEGVDDLNENKIESVDVFLYKQGDNPATADATVVKSVNVSTMPIDIRLGYRELTSLFNNIDTYDAATEVKPKVFVVVNRPAGTSLPQHTTTADLAALQVECASFGQSTYVDNEDPSKGSVNVIPTNFVMGSSELAEATLTDDDVYGERRRITATVSVRRAAAKVTLNLSKIVQTAYSYDEKNDPEHTTPTDTWHPLREYTRVEMVNLQRLGTVGLPGTSEDQSGFTSSEKKNLEAVRMVGNTTYSETMNDTEKEAITYSIDEVPFYTYPTDWHTNIMHRTHLILSVRWQNEAGTKWKDTYYEVPVSDPSETVDANTHYDITMDVGILGSDTRDNAATIVGCSYTILPWGLATHGSDTHSVEESMRATHYLVTSENMATMNNVDAYKIEYVSSHDVEIVDKKLEKLNIRGNTATWSEVDASTVSVVIYPPSKEGESGVLQVEHQLDNNMTSTSDYTDYRITFRVQHVGDERYNEDIEIVQHPMIYIEAEQNSNYIYPVAENAVDTRNNSEFGYVYVNTFHSYNPHRERAFDNIRGIISSGISKNPNRYIISISALSDDRYTIGDPRTTTVDNFMPVWRATHSTTSLATAETWNHYTQIINGAPVSYNTYNSLGSTYVNRSVETYVYNSSKRGIQDDFPEIYGDWEIGTSTAQWAYLAGEEYAYGPYNNPYDSYEETNSFYYYPSGATSSTPLSNNAKRVKYTAKQTIYVDQLKYYYPTENSERSKRMIAPKFMVASGYSLSYNLSYDKARKRCASYQEDGYPAGRWRLPTKAEVEFCVEQSTWGNIPKLFNSNQTSANYWCASGLINIAENTVDGKTEVTITEPTWTFKTYNASVRCVYDRWYWGDDKCPRNVFTWGDRER